MDQSVKQAAEALATAVARSTHKEEPTKTYIAMETIHADRVYAIGEDIELTESQATQLLKLGKVVEHGDKLAAKAAASSKDRDKQEIDEAHAKLEARARGEEPNNLGRLVVGPHGETIPYPMAPEYKIVDDKGKQLNVPAGKTETVVKGKAGASVKASASAKLEGPVPVQPQVIRSGRGTARGGSKVSYGKPGSTAGKAPVGGKGRGK